jgi:hypothetical protein
MAKTAARPTLRRIPGLNAGPADDQPKSSDDRESNDHIPHIVAIDGMHANFLRYGQPVVVYILFCGVVLAATIHDKSTHVTYVGQRRC